jgi:hypothetical protein
MGDVMVGTKKVAVDSLTYEQAAKVERPYEQLEPSAPARQRHAQLASDSAQAAGRCELAKADAPTSRDRQVREAAALKLNDLRRAAVDAAAKLQQSGRDVQVADGVLFDAVAPTIRARHRRVLDEKLGPALREVEIACAELISIEAVADRYNLYTGSSVRTPIDHTLGRLIANAVKVWLSQDLKR